MPSIPLTVTIFAAVDSRSAFPHATASAASIQISLRIVDTPFPNY